MEETTLVRLGSALRKVPGGGLPLDARNRWRTRQRRIAAERREGEFAERDRRRLDSLAGANDLRLNIGSSNMHVEGWINADLHRDPEGRSLQMDATEPWPFTDGAAEAVNSEHVIEHLERGDAEHYFREAFRVLRPGGVVR